MFKRGLILMELSRKEEAVAQFHTVFKEYPKTREGELATQQLQQHAPELLSPPPAPPPDKPGSRKPNRKP